MVALVGAGILVFSLMMASSEFTESGLADVPIGRHHRRLDFDREPMCPPIIDEAYDDPGTGNFRRADPDACRAARSDLLTKVWLVAITGAALLAIALVLFLSTSTEPRRRGEQAFV